MTPPIAPMAVGPSVTQKVKIFTFMVSLDPHIVSLDSRMFHKSDKSKNIILS